MFLLLLWIQCIATNTNELSTSNEKAAKMEACVLNIRAGNCQLIPFN